ncbi:hypothetical protein D3C80_2230410 [compost metagenome]
MAVYIIDFGNFIIVWGFGDRILEGCIKRRIRTVGRENFMRMRECDGVDAFYLTQLVDVVFCICLV